MAIAVLHMKGCQKAHRLPLAEIPQNFFAHKLVPKCGGTHCVSGDCDSRGPLEIARNRSRNHGSLVGHIALNFGPLMRGLHRRSRIRLGGIRLSSIQLAAIRLDGIRLTRIRRSILSAICWRSPLRTAEDRCQIGPHSASRRRALFAGRCVFITCQRRP